MIAKMSLKIAAFALAAAFSNIAGAVVSDLTNQYTLQSSATAVAGQSHEFVFNYSVTNLGQGYAGTQTGLDGFTIYIPTGAHIVSSVAPTPYVGSPGYWSTGVSTGLDLALAAVTPPRT